LGLAPRFDPRPYAPQWYLHRAEEKYIGWLEKYAIRIQEEQSLPGDIQLYRFGRCAAHGAIILNEHSMIHAYAPAGKVQIQGRRDVLSHGKIDSYWTVKI
jgi:cell wall-associated NlpC family hydrolase